ncbi:MAG: hypothetical protein LUG86_07085 [Oscillospiraceae bacterium]|nr:hypothetical protein [Oscillospiraceae bacterium]
MQEAVNAASGSTVTLTSNVTLTGTLNIYNSITLALGDYTITSSASEKAVYTTNTLVITAGNGGITATAGTAITNQKGSGSGSLTINGGTYTSSTANAIYNNGGTVTINSGSVTTTGSTAYDAILCSSSATVTVNGGTINGTRYGIYSTGSVVITNGTVSGTTAGVCLEGGTATISGGSISGAEGLKATSSVTSISITEGTFTGTTHGAYVACDNVTVSGGTFSATADWSSYPVGFYLGSGTSVTFSGGTFSGKYAPVWKADSNCTISYGEGCAVNTGDLTDNNSFSSPDTITRSVIKAVASITSGGTTTNYTSLAAAITAAGTTSTEIVLLADTVEDVEIPSGANITLDLNGYTITNSTTHTIINYGTLTIMDSSEGETGTVDCVTHACAALYNYGTITEISGGTFTRSAEQPYPLADGVSANSWYTVYNIGTITLISGGTFTTGDGSSESLGNNSSLICNGDDGSNPGTITTISGGTFTGAGNIIKNASGSSIGTISGGTFTMDNTVHGWWGGNNLIQNKTNATIGSITGGTFNALGTGVSANETYATAYNRYFLSTYSNVSISDATIVVEGDQNVVIDVASDNTTVTLTDTTVTIDEGSTTTLVRTTGTSSVSGGTYYLYDTDEGTSVTASLVATVVAKDSTNAYYYTSVEDAFTAASDGCTVTLLADASMTSYYTVSGGKSITLDLDGYTLETKLNVRNGSLTVKNGTISGTQPLNVYGSAEDVSGYSTLTIEDTVTISDAYWGICLFPNTNSDKLGYGATINLYGKIISEDDSTGIFISGNLGNSSETASAMAASSNASVVNIYGTITTGNQAVAMNGYAIVNVNSGAKITGSEAIGVKRGVLNVSGGELTATGDYVDPATANYNGTESTGAAISVTSTYNYAGTIVVNVTGGTIKSANGNALYIGHSGSESSTTTYSTGLNVSITGGDFSTSAESGDVATVYVAEAEEGDAESYTQAIISGGTFDSDVSEYCVSGMAAEYDTETQSYGIVAAKVASITSGDTTTYYTSLADAVSAASSTDTITILSDISELDTIVITDGKTVTIDLNDHTITFAYECNFRLQNGSLTLTGTGTVREKEDYYYYAPIMLYGMTSSEQSNTLVVDSGVTLKGWAGIFINAKSEWDYYSMDITFSGTIVSQKDVDNTEGSGIYLNGVAKNTTYYPTITIKDGASITNEDGHGIYAAGYGVWNIEGGTITSAYTGIEIRAGVLNISGGEIKSTKTDFNTSANRDGETVFGAGVAISQHTTVLPLTVNITGGTISGYYGIYEINYNSSNTNSVTVNVSGDDTKVTATGSGASAIYSVSVTGDDSVSASTNSITTIAVSGGSFSSIVPEAYCATGYSPVTEATDGYYTVTVSDSMILQLTTTSGASTCYSSLADALAAATSGDTITLLDNVSITTAATASVSMTIDLNGNTLTIGDSVDTDMVTLTVAEGASVDTDMVTLTVAEGATVVIIDSSEDEKGVVANYGTISISGTLDIRDLGYTTDATSAGGLLGQTSGKTEMAATGVFIVPDVWATMWSTSDSDVWSPNWTSATGSYSYGSTTYTGIFSSLAVGAKVYTSGTGYKCATEFAQNSYDANVKYWSTDNSYLVEYYKESNGKVLSTYNYPDAVEDNTIFAGWYLDSGYATVYTATNGVAYAKFVQLSSTTDTDGNVTAGVINFLGGSLRTNYKKTDEDGNETDETDYSMADLRFGYDVFIPDDCEVVSWSWLYTKQNSTTQKTVNGVYYSKTLSETTYTTNKVASEDNESAFRSNLVLTGISVEDYGLERYSKMTVVYETADGTTVTATDVVQTRTVTQVANGLGRSDTQGAGILAAIDALSS